jgi:ADP-heptose:LPS heptosyltransferase
MRLFPVPALQERLRSRIGPGPVVAIHISARQAIRRWPIERYADLMRHIGKERKVMLLWAPGPASDPRHPGDDGLAGEFPPLDNVAKVETPDLATLVAALSLADLVICPDGGAMHIAAALGKPVVALWADSPVERWRPWRVPHRVVRPESKNLADLPLGPVLDAYAALARGS